MKWPLVPVALFYVAGLLLAGVIHLPVHVLLLLAGLLCVTALCWNRAAKSLLWPLLVLAGWTNMQCHTAVLSPHDLRVVASTEPELLTVRGVLVETPTVLTTGAVGEEFVRTRVPLDCRELRRERREWAPGLGRILITMRGGLPGGYFAGAMVEVTGVLARPPEALAPGLFDYRKYLAYQGVYYQLRADSESDWKRISGPTTPPLNDRFIEWARRTMARGIAVEDESLRLLWSMVLGWKAGLTNEIYQPFMRSGTMHIFAISGLHIALIAAIMVALLRVAQIPRAWCGLLVVPTIWFYTGATGWQPSAIRSTLMMSLVIGGWALKRPGNLLNSLAAAALVILLLDPQQIFGVSFQLSFLVVLSIALIVPVIRRLEERVNFQDPLLPDDLTPLSRRLATKTTRWAIAFCATSTAAFAGSLPLTALYFHLLSPVTLLANLVIVPLSTASLASVLGSLFSAWLPVVPELFNQSAWWWMYCMVKLSNLATELPSGYEYIPCPTPWMFVLYYSGLAALCYGGNWPTKWKARAAVVWLILACVCLGWSHANQPEMVITIFPASAGSVVFAEGRRREATLLVDTGTTNSARFASIPFLRSRGVDRLGRLVLSHGEMRRMGGARELAMECRPDQVFASAARSRSKVYTRQLKLFANESRLRTVARGDKVGVWEVLHPEQYDKFARADDQAIVLFGTFSGIKVLLLSDLGPAGQAALLDRSPELRADLVVSGLCTKGEPLSDELLEQLKPKLIVVSDAEFPAAERARDDLRQRLKRAGCDVIYTSSSGAAVQVAIQGGKLQRLQP